MQDELSARPSRPAAASLHGTTIFAPDTAFVRGVRIFRRHWYVFVGCVVLGAAAAYVISSHKRPYYTAASALYFQEESFDSEVLGNNYVNPTADPAEDLTTDQVLIGLPAVATAAARLLGSPATAQSVSSAVTVSNDDGSEVDDITATATSPAAAADIANAYATAYISVREAADRSALTAAARALTSELQRQKAQPSSESSVVQLQTLLDRITAVSALQTGGAQIAQTAQPPQTAVPAHSKRDALFGGLAGLAFALIVVISARQLDRRIRTVRDLEGVVDDAGLGAGVLAVIPFEPALRALDPTTSAQGRTAEAFRLLRARLRYLNLTQTSHVITVTSGARTEGKTTVAFNLAASYAASGVRVLILEADLRRPRLARSLDLPSSVGLSEFLSRRELSLRDVVQQVTAFTPGVHDESPLGATLDVLLAGGTPPNPAELLQSPRMLALLAELRRIWDVVLVDTAPIGVVADAFPLLAAADGVLVVARMGVTTRDALHRLARELSRSQASVLGVVANGLHGRRSAAYHGGGYGGESGPVVASVRGARERA